MRRTLDLKFLACLLGSIGLFGTGVHVVHGFQVKRNANAFLDRANWAREADKPDQAADYLKRYLALRPHDTEALAEYGLLLEKQARSPSALLRAFLVLDQVLRLDPGRDDVRRRLVHVAMAIDRFGDAKDYLEVLRKAPPEDGELEELLGKCQVARGEYREARGSFERAIKLAPDKPDSYLLLAVLLRQQPSEVKAKGETAAGLVKLADEVMDALVKVNKGSFRAYVARAGYRQKFAPPGDSTNALLAAEQDLEEASRLAPEAAEVLLAGGEVARARHDFDKARAYLSRGWEKHPNDVRMCRLLAAVEVQDGKPNQAIDCLKQGLERVPGHTDLLWDLADALVRAGKIAEAGEVAGRLRKDNYRPGLVDYLQARIHMARKEWLPAARLLEGAYPLLTADEKVAEQTGLALGQCYELLGDSDRAQAAYNRIVALAPRSVAARLGLARVLATLGQVPEALDQYEQVMRLPGAPAGGWTEIARLRIVRNLQRDQPNWGEVDDALARAEQALPSAEVTILRADALAARKEYDKARAELEKTADAKKPRPVKVWVALAVLEERRGNPDAALGLLDQAQRELGDHVELRLARAQHWSARKGPAALAGLSRLPEDITQFTDEERQRLLRGLAGAYARAGAPEQAERLWARLAEQLPDDLGIRVAQFDLASQAGDEAAMGRILEDMRRIEGPEGTLWRYGKVCQLMAQAGRAGGQGIPLDEARSLLAFVAARRPRWSRVPLCAAQVEELRKNPDGALTNYLAAIRLGDRSPLAIRRAAEMLAERRRYAEANDIIRKLPEHVPLSGDLQRVAAEVMFRAGEDKDRALGLAEKAVAADSKDYRGHIWLGRMLAASGHEEKAEKAEQAFRRAVALADNSPDTWLALIQYLVAVKRTKEAEAEIEKARQKITGDRVELVLAQCHELVGHKKEAEALYRVALGAHAEDVAVLQAVAGFFLRSGDLGAAEPHLRKIVRLEKDPRAKAVANRQLALVLSSRGGYRESREALELVGVILDEGQRPRETAGGTVEEQRTRATFLAVQQSRRERRQAIPILEGLTRKNQSTPEDQFLLAQVYEADGNWPKARHRLAHLAALPKGENPRSLAHRAYYANLLLTHGETEEAQVWVQKLEEQEPDSFRTQSLKVRLLKAQGKDKEAVALLQTFARGKEADVLAAVAGLLEGIKEPDAAERVYRDYVKAAGAKRPESSLVLAQYLGRQGRVQEALDVCEEARKTCRPLAVTQACLLVISGATPDSAQCERVEQWLAAAVEKDPQSSGFQAALAHIKTLRGRYDEAEGIYRKAIEKNGRDTMALNNLAFLLALRGGRGEEALKWVERACQIGGPQPGFLDTRAIAALSLGRSELALKDLNEVIQEDPSGSAYFHLALAHQMARNPAEARKALQMARSRGLKDSDLNPLERAAYDELVRKLGPG